MQTLAFMETGETTMNLGFDIDGVISNFTDRFKEIVNNKYSVCLTNADLYCYDADLVLGISKEEAAEIAVEIVKSDLPLNSMAKETLHKLSAEGHNIYLLTARSERLTKYTLAWLKRKKIPYKEILHLVGGRKYLANVSVDLVVDDSLEEALEYAKTVKHVLVFDQPWNKTANVKQLVKRVYSWSDIHSEIQNVSKTSQIS